MTEWHIRRNGKEEGPVDTQQLKRLAAAGELQPTDQIWREGMAEWVPASQAKGLEFGQAKNIGRLQTTADVTRKTPGTTSSPSQVASPSAEASSKRIPKSVYMVGAAAVLVLIVSAALWLVLRDRSDTKTSAEPTKQSLAVEKMRQEADSLATLKGLESQANAFVESGDLMRGIDKYQQALDHIKSSQTDSPEFATAIGRISRAKTAASAKLGEEGRRQDADRKRIEEEKRIASIRATIKGGAWLVNAEGASNLLRGMDIKVVKTEVPKRLCAEMLDALVRDNARELASKEARADQAWSTFTQCLNANKAGPLNPDKLGAVTAKTADLATTFVVARERAMDKLLAGIQKAADAREAEAERNGSVPKVTKRAVMHEPMYKAIEDVQLYLKVVLEQRERNQALARVVEGGKQPTTRPTADILTLYELYLTYRTTSEKGDAKDVWWKRVFATQAIANTHVDVEGKYQLELSGGNYCLFALSTSSQSRAYWFLPVNIHDSTALTINFCKENTRPGFVDLPADEAAKNESPDEQAKKAVEARIADLVSGKEKTLSHVLHDVLSCDLKSVRFDEVLSQKKGAKTYKVVVIVEFRANAQYLPTKTDEAPTRVREEWEVWWNEADKKWVVWAMDSRT